MTVFTDKGAEDDDVDYPVEEVDDNERHNETYVEWLTIHTATVEETTPVNMSNCIATLLRYLHIWMHVKIGVWSKCEQHQKHRNHCINIKM